MIQVDTQGRIVTINAPQASNRLKSLDMQLAPNIAAAPELYRWDGKTFVFSLKAQQENEQAEMRAKARHYLDATDFYVTRKVETGEVVPPEVLTKRAKARTLLVTQLPSFE